MSAGAQKLRQRTRSEPVRRDRGEEGEHGQALAQVDLRDLLRETQMPACRRPLVLLRLTVGEEECAAERLRQGDELETPTRPRAPP